MSLFLFLLLSAGCTPMSDSKSPLDSAGEEQSTPSDSAAPQAEPSSEEPAGEPAGEPSEETIAEQTSAICERWNGDRAELNEGTWDGDISSCNAGTASPEGLNNALKLVNLYRWITGLSEVSYSDALNESAQQCSLLMHAEDTLSHFPDSSFACYNEVGAEAASGSSLSPTPGVEAVDLYMSDPGNSTTLGHRRWILSNGLGPIGLGSTSAYSCMYVFGGSGNDNRPWTAWPPEGIVPIELMNLSWASVDETGWSLQSDTIDLSNASVQVTRDDGADLTMTVTPLGQWYGSQYAISMLPNGWTTEANRTYDVRVEAAGSVIEYTVHFVGCN